MKELKMGDKVLVSITYNGENWEERIFIKYGCNGGIICVSENWQKNYYEGEKFETVYYNHGYWKPILKPQYKPFENNQKNRDFLRDKWVRDKRYGNECKIDSFGTDKDIWMGLSRSDVYQNARRLFEEVEFLDGTLFGEKIEENKNL